MISPFKRKILKISAYILGSIIVLLVSFHFWFINHAEQLIEELVKSSSNGKLKLEVKKFKFNWFSKNMQLRNAVFQSTDTSAATSYRFSVEKINIRVKEIWPLIFEKKILIDSLGLINPDIEVTRLRYTKNTDTDTDTTKNNGASLPHEMGKVYNSIQDALQVLQVNRFQITNGKFSLINKIKAGELPVTITNIFFRLDNLQVDSSTVTGTQKILFSDNVTLHTYNQDISFPDGRHRLSFSNFRINILKKMVEFDSCTISATKGDSAKSSFSVFFDKLQMTNIDFDTLYQNEVIKADSVYCINPRFKLDVELEKRTGKRKPPPRLDELIQLLMGDMQLAFVVVNNGSFDINTVRDGEPSSFTSDHNNFEMQGFRIEQNSPKPLTVNSFAMAIRNYENFLRDSAYSMEFDSILFINKSIYLSNFSLKQMEDDKVINSFNVPQFELKGLSWDDLVFERKLTADRATLYRPVINYTILENKKQNIFKTLAGIGEIIQLNNVDISNGQVNVHFKGGAQLQLEDASMSILSQGLVRSSRIANLQRSVRELRFKKGSLKIGGLAASMENVNFSGKDGQLTAGSIDVIDKEKNLSIKAKDVAINSMIIDNNSYKTEINGIQWQQAEVQITKSPLTNNKMPAAFIIRNIKGNNTKLVTSTGNQKLSVFMESVSADEFLTGTKNKPSIINLRTNGKSLFFTDNNRQLSIGHFLFADHHNSDLQNVSFVSNTPTDSVSVIIPAISFAPDLNSIINGAIIADNIKLVQPVISIKQFHQLDTDEDEEDDDDEKTILPEAVIGKLTVLQPEFLLVQSGDKDARIEWHGNAEKNNFFDLSNFKIKNNPSTSVSADQFAFALNNFSVTTGDKTFTTGKGSINTKITGLRLDSVETDHWDWKGIIADLQVKDIVFDNLGKHEGRLDVQSARLNDLTIKSTSVSNFRQVLKENAAFRLKETSGQFDDANNHFDWHNLNYDKISKILSVDSFTFHPTMAKDSFIASHQYQTDYMTFSTGLIDAGPFDIDTYLTDTVLNAGTVNINNVFMTSFRDKRKPVIPGAIKPLPVNLLKKIPVHLSLDTVNLNNANIELSELNEKTNQTGTILINRMQAKIFPVNNYSMQDGDSLRFEAQAWLMDSVRITLKLRESYTDSLAGFLMSASAGSVESRILNPVLIPLTSFKIESGYLDTLSMRVVGREYLALGEMKMYYHDLKVQLVNNGVEKKKNFITKFASFLANTFIIKNNNSSRPGVIYFQRNRNKSALNYLVKITLSGISSSVGVKKNKKLLRKYKKQLRKRNLPPIEYD